MPMFPIEEGGEVDDHVDWGADVDWGAASSITWSGLIGPRDSGPHGPIGPIVSWDSCSADASSSTEWRSPCQWNPWSGWGGWTWEARVPMAFNAKKEENRDTHNLEDSPELTSGGGWT